MALATEIELVRLAIELARLRGEKEPGKFLDEAARLLTEASFALSGERARPEREAKEQSERAHQCLVKSFSDQMVRFEKLCRAARGEEKIGATAFGATEHFEFDGENGKVSFDWRVYRDERDLKRLLEKHADRIYKEAGKKLCAIEADASWGEKAIGVLAGPYWISGTWQKKFQVNDSFKDRERLVKEYVAEATQAFFEDIWRRAKADHMDVVTLASIFETRHATYKNRGRNVRR